MKRVYVRGKFRSFSTAKEHVDVNLRNLFIFGVWEKTTP